MKVLIDECAPKAMKVALAASGFDCTTVQEAGWSGKENGELLALADASFDVVVTRVAIEGLHSAKTAVIEQE
jgi:predicted nuclease of predicted toxin-antitoxin system